MYNKTNKLCLHFKPNKDRIKVLVSMNVVPNRQIFFYLFIHFFIYLPIFFYLFMFFFLRGNNISHPRSLVYCAMWKPHYLANTYKLVKQLTLITSKKWTPKITINPAKQPRGPRCLHMIDAAKAINNYYWTKSFFLFALINTKMRLPCVYYIFFLVFLCA